MYRAIPEGNRLVTKRHREQERKLHKSKLASAKSCTDTTVPSVYAFGHLRVNMKKEQLLEERYSEIDRTNQILLQKMTEILRQPSLPPITQRSPRGPASLNKDSRRRELVRITNENQNILKRIQEAQPVYNHVQWEASWRKSERYLRTACVYPVILNTRRRKDTKGAKLGKLPLDTDDLEVKERAPDPQKELGPKSARRAEPLSNSVFGVQFVHKESIPIGDRHYLVEIGTDGRALTITAYDGISNTTLELLLNEKTHRRLYREAGGNYGGIARRLAIENGKLVVAIPTDALAVPEEVEATALDADTMVLPTVPQALPPAAPKSSSVGSAAGGKVTAKVDLVARSDGGADVNIGVKTGLSTPTQSSVVADSVLLHH